MNTRLQQNLAEMPLALALELLLPFHRSIKQGTLEVACHYYTVCFRSSCRDHSHELSLLWTFSRSYKSWCSVCVVQTNSSTSLSLSLIITQLSITQHPPYQTRDDSELGLARLCYVGKKCLFCRELFWGGKMQEARVSLSGVNQKGCVVWMWLGPLYWTRMRGVNKASSGTHQRLLL